MPQDDILLNRGATQVDVAVLQADVFVWHRLAIGLEWRRLALVQQLEIPAQNFDGTRFELGVFEASGSGDHLSGDLDHVLVAE